MPLPTPSKPAMKSPNQTIRTFVRVAAHHGVTLCGPFTALQGKYIRRWARGFHSGHIDYVCCSAALSRCHLFICQQLQTLETFISRPRGYLHVVSVRPLGNRKRSTSRLSCLAFLRSGRYGSIRTSFIVGTASRRLSYDPRMDE